MSPRRRATEIDLHSPSYVIVTMNKYTFSFFISVIFTGVVFSVPVFNGKDLSGWTMDVPALDKKPNLAKPFIVRNGMLVSLGKPAGHLLTENEPFVVNEPVLFKGSESTIILPS